MFDNEMSLAILFHCPSHFQVVIGLFSITINMFAFSRILYNGNHTKCSLLRGVGSGFFYSVQNYFYIYLCDACMNFFLCIAE